MLAEQRRQLILERLKERGAIRTSELSELFAVSEMTIRNDLKELLQRGMLERIHGGAITKDKVTFEPSYHDKTILHSEEKRRIGQAAATLIEEGMAVFIGNGTTTMQIVKHLDGSKRITAFTNSLNHAIELSEIPSVDLSVIGGHLRGKSYAMVGPLAKQSLEFVYFDLIFLGVDGISFEQGLTIPSLNEADTARALLKRARQAIIVADHSKFGKVTHGKIADIEEIDRVITDDKVDERYKEKLAELNVELIIA